MAVFLKRRDRLEAELPVPACCGVESAQLLKCIVPDIAGAVGRSVDALVVYHDKLTVVTDRKAAFEAGKAYMCKLAYASEVSVLDNDPEGGEGMVSVITDNTRMFMPLSELVDMEKEIARTEKELANAEKLLAGQNAKLANENFVSRAPEAVVNAEREKKAKLEALIENLRLQLANMKK